MLGKLLGNFATGGLLEAGKGIAKLFSNYQEKKISKEMFLAELVNEIPRMQIKINETEASTIAVPV